MSKVWIVYEPQDYQRAEIYGVFRRKRDALSTYNTERENLRASGNTNWSNIQMEEHEVWPPPHTSTTTAS